MTASELLASARNVVRVIGASSIRAGTQAAFPLEGPARWSAYFGPEIAWDRVTLGAEWHLPFVGDAYSSKLLVEAIASY